MWWFAELASAWAGACCVGSTSAVPARLGECEHVLAGVGLAGELAVARWDPEGTVAGASPDETNGAVTALVGARWSRWGQATVQLPTRFQHRVAGDLVDDGAGVGDLIAGVTVDPLEERLGPHGGGLPVPVVTLSLRAPTGRDWTDSDGPLLADTTGVEGFGGRAAVQVERTMGTPWWLGTDLALDPHLPARIGVAGGVGRYLGTDWTLSGTLRHERQLTADGTARTLVGARVIRGQRLAWRAWVGAGTDVGLSGLGADLPVLASADLGLAWIH
ncbi:MAG: hypothetical protein KC621_02050 [Myxococcales bacterium]|nr:hypothetical protein [Myxococcales bacterium]